MALKLDKSFNYNKGQRRAIMVLGLLILILIFLRFSLITSNSGVYNYDILAQKIDYFINNADSASPIMKNTYQENRVLVNLRPFNPNSTSFETFLELGLTPRQARSILKYLSKGGQFTFRSDLKRIYTITDKDFQRLESYILLPENQNKKEYKPNKNYDIEIEPLEINSAFQEDLLSIRGIGPVLSNSIIKYRSMLGGFYATAQLKEVYGIDSLTYEKVAPYFVVAADSIKKINLNKINYYDLRKHPYISNQQAFEITNRVKYKGKFKQMNELLQLETINDSIYEKIYHYFVVQ